MLATAAVVATLVSAAVAGPFPATYDAPIKDAWAVWHPGEDWRWGKAQFWQESHLKPDARSPVGAEGIGQFMPATWREVPAAVRLGVVDRRAAEPSIRAGAWYMGRMKRVWKAPRPADDRRRLAQASYNAGAGSIIRAQTKCNGAPDWRTIASCLPAVTGRHSAETIGYVARIARWHGAMQ